MLTSAAAAAIWGLVYIVVGARAAGTIPAAYSVLSLGNTVLLAMFRCYQLYRFTQLALILLLPWVMMISLLKDEHRSIADHYDAASILFADVVQFTPMARSMSPMELVALLDEVFMCFDSLVEKYRLEKKDDR